MTEALYVLDGMALAYRAFYAFSKANLRTRSGLPTGAVFGFAKEVIDLLDKRKPRYFAIAWDAPGETLRHKLLDSYKAHRPETPEDLLVQLPYIQRFAEALAIPFLQTPGYEADDIIATLVKRAEKEGLNVYILSHDKDLMQLVSDRVHLLASHPKGGFREYDPAEVENKFGVPPSQMGDLLALMGDTSDNIPGVPGIGPKTAAKLLREWENVENLYAHLDQVQPERIQKLLREHRDLVQLSQELTRLHADVPLEVSWQELHWEPPLPREPVEAICDELEFRSLKRRLEPWLSKSSSSVKVVTKELPLLPLSEGKNAQKALRQAKRAGFFCIWADVEPSSWRGKLRELYLVTSEGAFACPPLTNAQKALVPLLESPQLTKVFFHGKQLLHGLTNAGLSLTPPYYDLMLAAYLLDPGGAKEPLWEEVVKKYLGQKATPPQKLQGELFSDEAPRPPLEQLPLLYEHLKAELKARGLEEALETLEHPLFPILARMERQGILLAPEVLTELETELEQERKLLEQQIHKEAGEAFNIQSTKELQRILFEKLELHKTFGLRLKRTKTGYSTDQSVLERLKGHPLPQKILEYRKLAKLLSTYIRPLAQWRDRETGRIHTTFHQALTATGRLSSSRPNLQNIPIRTKVGEQIRRAFVAPSGWRLLSADYSQIELRLLAHFSEDPHLLEAFASGEDIHRATAAKIFSLPPEEVTSGMRAQAKTINFGILYGMGVQKLARELEISQEEAKRFRENYFATYPQVRAYLDSTLEQARREGKVTTLLGRCRWLPEIRSSHPRIRAEAERMAINTPIQGSAADLIKLAMIQLEPLVASLGGHLLLQIHDELLFEFPEEVVENASEEVRKVMEGVYPLKVPLKVNVGIGQNWLEAAH